MWARCAGMMLTMAAGVWLAAAALAQDPDDNPPPPPVPQAQEGVEVMARGPVHEAYAEPTELRPEPSPLVEKEPPPPIEEMPPDQKPEGESVVWIPGYWGWDQDQSDFVWVSGFWRTPPPRRQWVPGTWQQVEGGWHWVPGFWAPLNQQQLQYLPPPPPLLDRGPSVPQPAASSSYVSGCWIYREGRYRWRPGFWLTHRPGWVWIPAHYLWTPGGFLFVDGYWDHPLERRGLLFAPVRLAARLRGARRFTFVPQYTVQPDFLLSALFVRPNLGHYYFGDYFEDRYVQAGFVPWYDYRVSRFSYDPNFSYYRAGFSGAGSWERNLRALYQARFRGDVPRPPRTLIQQNQVIQTLATNQTQNAVVSRSLRITNVQNVSVLAPVNRVQTVRVTHLAGLAGLAAAPPALAPRAPLLRLEAVAREQRIQHQQAAVQVQAIAQHRRKVEAQILTAGPPARVNDAPRQVQLPLPQVPNPGNRPNPAPGFRQVPALPTMPRHEDQPIPRHDPIRMPAPPRGGFRPVPQPPAPQPQPPRPPA